jgi:hypothetical protein
MPIDAAQAERLVRAAAAPAPAEGLASAWTKKVERLSLLCEPPKASKTHIAFLATAILAKAVDANADLFAIKPEHDKGNPNAFSAPSLCHSVLVPLSAELGFSLGVGGREPLNNQPYFRMKRLDDGTPISTGGRDGFNYMLELVRELQQVSSNKAREALQAFIAVRRQYIIQYADLPQGGMISPEGLTNAIAQFVTEDSEGGKRAQAVVAGLLDIVAGRDRVETGLINDPSRHYPGDVAIRNADVLTTWEKAIEVRDKPVSSSDVHIFARRCAEQRVNDAAIVMASDRQPVLDSQALAAWASGLGIGLTLFYGWRTFVDQALFWSALPKPLAALQAVDAIHERLKGVQVTSRAVTLWHTLSQSQAMQKNS